MLRSDMATSCDISLVDMMGLRTISWKRIRLIVSIKEVDPVLDPDLLRTFVCIAEEGSFTRAGQRVGRTQSAVSMQLQRLETQLGQRLISRGKGGAVHLTPHGQFLLERARELLALNEQIWTSFKTPTVQGAVRLGTPD